MIKERFSPEMQQNLSDDAWMILQEDYRPEGIYVKAYVPLELYGKL